MQGADVRKRIRRQARSTGPSRGGIARAAKLAPERRREIAVLAARARWSRRKVAAAGSGYPEPVRRWEDAMAQCERENPAPKADGKHGDAILI